MRLAPSAFLVGLLLTLAGCDSGADASATPSAATPATPAQFDAIVLGSERDRAGDSDLYGLTFHPLRTFRLTTGKRVDDFSALADRIVVSAADQQVDKLGELAPGGQITDVPGLGRPHAFGPELRPGGVVRYEDNEGGGTADERFVEWDPRTGKTSVLSAGPSSVFGAARTGPEGTLFYYDQGRATHGRVVVTRPDKSVHPYRVAPDIGNPAVGPKLIAVTVDDSVRFDTATGLVLLDPMTGRQIPVPGWSPIAWSPDGARLLVEHTDGATNAASELALLDPGDPAHPRPIGTVPHLTMYQGSWLRGTPIP